MKTVEFTIYTGFYGADHEGSFDVEDDTTDEEIDSMVAEEVWNHIETSWRIRGEK